MAIQLVNPLDNALTRLIHLGPTIGDFVSNPAFGIPIIGHALNLPALAAGTASALDPTTTPSDSDAFRQFETQGAIPAWRDRQDINPWLKFATETGLGFTGPFNSAVIKPLGAGFKGLRGAVTGFDNAGPAIRSAVDNLPLGNTLRPSVDALTRDIPDTIPGIKNIPGIDQLFQTSKTGQVNRYRNIAQDLGDLSRSRNIPPQSIINEVRNLGITTDDGMRRAGKNVLRIGENQAVDYDKLRDLFDRQLSDTKDFSGWEAWGNRNTNPQKTGRWDVDPSTFYQDIQDAAVQAARKDVGYRAGKFSNTYAKINDAVRGVLLSGMTAPLSSYVDYERANVMRNGWGDIGGVWRNRQASREAVDRLENGGRMSAHSGVNPLEDMQQNNQWLHNLPNSHAAVIGGGLGAASAAVDPEHQNIPDILTSAGLGALSGLLTKQGYVKGMDLLQKGETIGRTEFYKQGAEKFFNQALADETLHPKMQEISSLLGSGKAGQARAQKMLSFLRENKGFVTDNDLVDYAAKLGIPKRDSANTLNKVRVLFNDLKSEARDAGINSANEIGYNYSETDNLTEAAKKVLPFPVWPMRNAAFFTKEFGDKPEWAWPVLDYLGVSEDNKNAEGLTSRMGYKMPLMGDLAKGIAGGSLWGNPASLISIAGQVQEPVAHPAGEQISSLDKLTDMLGNLGISPTPTIAMPLQALGIVDRGSDFQSISPWSRLVAASHQAGIGGGKSPITPPIIGGGDYIDPEAAIKNIFEGVRGAVAPTAQSDVSYPEYLVRKKLAEESLERTGQPWYKNTDYLEAMVDKSSPLYQEASRKSGNEQANTMAIRKILPIQVQWLPNEEQKIRSAKKQSQNEGLLNETGQLAENVSEDQLPAEALGYKRLSDSDKDLVKKVYDLLPDTHKEQYLAKHPELKRKLDSQKNKNKGF